MMARSIAISLWLSYCPIYMNWNGHAMIVLPWDGILVCIPLRSRDRVEALSYHLPIGYLKEYETPLQQWGAIVCLGLSFWPIVYTEMVKVVLWCHVVILCFKHLQEAQMKSKLGLCIFLREWKGVWTPMHQWNTTICIQLTSWLLFELKWSRWHCGALGWHFGLHTSEKPR